MFFNVLAAHEGALLRQETVNACATLSYENQENRILEPADGVRAVYKVMNRSTRKVGYLTLWQDERTARQYANTHRITEVEYFDTPVLMNNSVNPSE